MCVCVCLSVHTKYLQSVSFVFLFLSSFYDQYFNQIDFSSFTLKEKESKKNGKKKSDYSQIMKNQ